jgi:hypothetical protein
MKKTILVVVLVLITIFTINAQEKDEFTRSTEKLVELITKPALQSTINNYKAVVSQEKITDFLNEINSTLPELYSTIAKSYMKEFTHEDVKKLLVFYNSEVGRKLAVKKSVLLQSESTAIEFWAIDLQNFSRKYH